MNSRPTVEWFGTTTFRVQLPGLDLFFDGYLDRLPGLDPCHHDPLLPGLPGTDVTEAAALLEARKPGSYFSLEYATAWPLFG